MLIVLLVVTNGRFRVTVEESFPNDVLSSDDPKLLCSCVSIWQRGKRMDGRILRCACINGLQVCYQSTNFRYTIAELCRGPLCDSRPAVGGMSVYVNYRPALLYKFPHNGDVTTILDIYVHCIMKIN